MTSGEGEIAGIGDGCGGDRRYEFLRIPLGRFVAGLGGE